MPLKQLLLNICMSGWKTYFFFNPHNQNVMCYQLTLSIQMYIKWVPSLPFHPPPPNTNQLFAKWSLRKEQNTLCIYYIPNLIYKINSLYKATTSAQKRVSLYESWPFLRGQNFIYFTISLHLKLGLIKMGCVWYEWPYNRGTIVYYI